MGIPLALGCPAACHNPMDMVQGSWPTYSTMGLGLHPQELFSIFGDEDGLTKILTGGKRREEMLHEPLETLPPSPLL